MKQNNTFDYPMSAKHYRAALAEFGLSQEEAGWLFGGKSRKSGRRWGVCGAPFAVALIIELMRAFDLDAEDIEEIGAPWRKRKD